METIALFMKVIEFLRSKLFLYLSIITLILIVIFFWKSNRDMKADFELVSNSTQSHLEDKKNELMQKLTKRDMKLHLQEEKIDSLLKSVDVKPKQVIRYKYINLDRTLYDTLFLYELLEINDYRRKFLFEERCFTAEVDLSGSNPTIKADIKTSLYDINYKERRNLWGKKWLPRWGKNQIRQTLISDCGDTIRENYLITTE